MRDVQHPEILCSYCTFEIKGGVGPFVVQSQKLCSSVAPIMVTSQRSLKPVTV